MRIENKSKDCKIISDKNTIWDLKFLKIEMETQKSKEAYVESFSIEIESLMAVEWISINT